MITVCVPVLKRYDLLEELVASLDKSTISVSLSVIDNGRDASRMRQVIAKCHGSSGVFTPNRRMGVAESWNWFIQNVPEERVISNDDVVFAPDSLEKLLSSKADLVWAANQGFSCFVIRDSCVAKLGLFDETISPGYAYYEDDDYLQRLDGRGTREPSATAENVECGIVHTRSSTLQACSGPETMEHHFRFKIAQGNYMKKWGLTRI